MSVVRIRGEASWRAAKRFLQRDSALAATEYAMLVAFVAIVIVGVLTVFGPQISGWLAARTGVITTV